MTGTPAWEKAAQHRRRRSSWLRARPAATLVSIGAVCLLTTTTASSSTSGPSRPSRHPAAAISSPAPAATTLAKLAPEPEIIPKPATMTAGRGWFSLTPRTRIAVTGGQSLAVARDLAGYLRPATGYPLPVVTGGAQAGDIALVLGSTGIKADAYGEGYRLTVTPAGLDFVAQAPHGLYDGIQTIRQLLPAWISSPTRRTGPWMMPAVSITDYPRYAYRGVMLDIGRHYEPPSAVEQLIDQAAAYKIDVLHLHLSDDQGFRLVIDGFPRLSRIGGQGSVGTGGRAEDPGGYWTQAQYRAVVADAAAHFVTVVPEVDSPGHDNAIIMSEYDDTANPLLNGHPQDIDCGAHNPPEWDFSEDVGYSALCPASKNTWTILSAIISQLAAMSPGPYYDMGGDEVPATVLSPSAYASFVSQEAKVVQAHGKTLMGWADIAGPGTRVPRGSVAEYWEPAGGSSAAADTAREAVKKGMKIVMAPADHAYLDQKYLGGALGDAPPGLGQTWACPVGCDLSAAYNWNPGFFVTGVTDRNVIGVEGAVWSETLVDLSTVDYLTFPRLLALAEVGWSPSVKRSAHSPAYLDFLHRIAAQGGRLMAAGVNFYPSAEVRWQLQATGTGLAADLRGVLSATLATVAAPGLAPGAISASVNWGDGATTSSGLAGPPPAGQRVNSLYAVQGTHDYRHPGLYHGTVTLRTASQSPVKVTFTVRVP